MHDDIGAVCMRLGLRVSTYAGVVGELLATWGPEEITIEMIEEMEAML